MSSILSYTMLDTSANNSPFVTLLQIHFISVNWILFFHAVSSFCQILGSLVKTIEILVLGTYILRTKNVLQV